MSDNGRVRPDHACLFDVASEQHGYFTAAQAHTCGFGWRILFHHVKRGRFLHVRRGLYRLRDYPSSPREEVVAAWIGVGKHDAAVSHESALDLLDLSDVIPQSVHLIVPRGRRGLNPPPGVTVHTATHWLRPDEVTTIHGIRVTTAARSIVDAAEAGTGPEQIEMAVAQALRRALATPKELLEQASTRGSRVARLIAGAIARAPTTAVTPGDRKIPA
jgi:predicted transcriptional regulator of viral defense system